MASTESLRLSTAAMHRISTVRVNSPTRSAGPCPPSSTAYPASRDFGLGEEGKWKVGQCVTARDHAQRCLLAMESDPRHWAPRPPECLQPYRTWARMAGSHEWRSSCLRRLWPGGRGNQGEVKMQVDSGREGQARRWSSFLGG